MLARIYIFEHLGRKLQAKKNPRFTHISRKKTITTPRPVRRINSLLRVSITSVAKRPSEKQRFTLARQLSTTRTRVIYGQVGSTPVSRKLIEHYRRATDWRCWLARFPKSSGRSRDAAARQPTAVIRALLLASGTCTSIWQMNLTHRARIH